MWLGTCDRVYEGRLVGGEGNMGAAQNMPVCEMLARDYKNADTKKNLITKNKLQERQKKHGRQNRGTVPGPQNLNSRVPCSKVAESPGEKKTWKFGVYVRIRLQPVVPLMS